MANNKDFIVKNAVEVGGPTKVTVGDAASAGSYTAGYGLASAAYDSKSLLVSGSETRPITIAMSSDGTKFYVGGQTGDALDQYTLSTAYDISTASYDSVTFSYASTAGVNVQGIFFKSDGTKFFLTDDQNNTVYAYSMSTAWDLSTASYDSVSFSVSSQSSANTNGIEFTSDGTKFFVIGKVGTTPTIYQYNMTTAWDISTASYSNNSLVVTSQLSTGANDIRLNGDATKLYAGSNTANEIFQYDMTTAGDLSTASYSGASFSTNSQTTAIFNFCFGDSGVKLYVCDFSTDTVFQYSTGSTVTTGSFDLSTGNYFTDTPSADVEYTFSNAGDVQSFQLEVTGNQSVVGYDLANASYDSVNLTLSSPTLEDITAMQFKPDGLKCYLLPVKLSDNIRQCTLSTAWDISTATYDSGKIFDVSSQESSPEGFAFKPDGTKLYVTGITSDAVYQYTLSTAWDISTASYDSVSFSVSAYEATPSDIKFKTDGTRMYVSGRNYIDQYDLSTAWDLSTASYDATSSAISTVSSPYEASIRGISFNADGTSVFTAGHTDDSVQEFSLATAWDISSTLTHVQTFDTSSQSLNPQFVEFGNNGTKMYVPYPATGTIYQYSTSTTNAITVTWDADIAWPSGTAPDSPAAGEKDIYTFTTDDGGTTYIGVQSGDAFS